MKGLHLILLFVILTLTGCWESNRWTEEERNAFEKKCNQTREFEVSPICFEGFEYQDSIMIIVKNNKTILDTLFTRMRMNQNKFVTSNNKIWNTHLPKLTFNINNQYDFYIGKEAPYELNNMEMIMWAQYTEVSEGWGCKMGNYTIDNIKHENSGNIRFKKREE